MLDEKSSSSNDSLPFSASWCIYVLQINGNLDHAFAVLYYLQCAQTSTMVHGSSENVSTSFPAVFVLLADDAKCWQHKKNPRVI